MPVYEYQCEKCKDIVEVLQKISDNPLSECEKCGGTLNKQFNTMNFHWISWQIYIVFTFDGVYVDPQVELEGVLGL